MKKLKLLFNKYVLNKIEKRKPKLYRFLLSNAYMFYSEVCNFFKYRDKYFFCNLYIEINSYCNRKCNYCPNKDFETPNNFMTEEVFKKSISDLKIIKYTGVIYYHFYNEPLFDNRLESFVSYVKKELPKCVQVIFSNGDILDIDRANNLIKSGVDKFIITVHDINPEKGLTRLGELKNILREKMRLQSTSDLELIGQAGNVDVSKYSNSKKSFEKCPSILGPIITLNGDIVICCHDYHRKHVMGNIMKNSIIDIWNSYSSLRYDLLENNKVELEICKKCLGINSYIQ